MIPGWRAAVARGVYSNALRVALPAYFAKLWWRGRVEPLYRHAWGERIGSYREAPSHGWIWLHAVSLGETRAAAALVDALRALRPGLKLLLTHGTATGREAGAALLREGDRQVWLPFDTPGTVRRFLAQFRPAIGVLMETEIWPNLLAAAQAHEVPVVLANARLSERSAHKGERLAPLLHPAVASIARVLAQTEDDARRLRAAGARDVQVCGNLKYDMRVDAALVERGRAWRTALRRPVLLFAVSREGEEAMLLDAWRTQAASMDAPPLLLIVPRHPQRFDEVHGLLAGAGMRVARRSTWAEVPPAEAIGADAWLGDSMREMPLYYGLADAALLGGSFAPLGGQNLIEAAACGCPIVMGPHTFNFAEAAELAAAAGAATRVADLPAALAAALALIVDPDARERQALAALAFADQHRGAAQRMAQRIVALLPS